jgi:hypothetical protein
MSLSWYTRKTRLRLLLKSCGNEGEDALALDRLLHGQAVIGKTCMPYASRYFLVADIQGSSIPTATTVELDALRFQDSDLRVVGRLARGQFGLVRLGIPSLKTTSFVLYYATSRG